MKRLMLILGMLGGLGLIGCGGAEVTADDDPGQKPSDFKAGTEADFSEGDFGADIDIDENDQYEQGD